MTTTVSNEVVTPNEEFAQLASDAQIARVAQALEANGMRALVVPNGDEARRMVLELLPEGAEVFTMTSRTLDRLGLSEAIDGSERYNAVRPKRFQLDRRSQGDAMRRLGASPAITVGSVHAVTESGQVVIASASGSQLGPYGYAAGKVLWVVGAQKIVPNLNAALRRVYEYSFPLEDARTRKAYGMGSGVNKLLIVNREFMPGRVTVVLVKERLGF
jgi:hypothetical protein